MTDKPSRFVWGAHDIQIQDRPSTGPEMPPPVEPITAAAVPARQREAACRRLVDIDRELRAKLHTAANAAVLRALERSGAKVVSKARGKGAEAIRASIAGVPAHEVVATVGPAVVAALGLSAAELANEEFTALQEQYDGWMIDAKDQALRQVAKMSGRDHADVVRIYETRAAAQFDADLKSSWTWLADRMRGVLNDKMTNSSPGGGLTSAATADTVAGGQPKIAAPIDAGAPVHQAVGEQIVIAAGQASSLVSMGLIRGAMAIAGGITSFGVGGILDSGRPQTIFKPLKGLATGYMVSEVIGESGMVVDYYEWVHGPSSNPFEPHERLDGVQFQSFDDPALTNYDSFPDFAFYTPGDHDGCLCDYDTIFVESGTSMAISDVSNPVDVTIQTVLTKAAQQIKGVDNAGTAS